MYKIIIVISLYYNKYIFKFYNTDMYNTEVYEYI